MQFTRRLRVELERHEVAVGTEFTVRVRDDRRRPVEGAVVEAGRKSARVVSSGPGDERSASGRR
ncbi:hypothetical protein A6E15_15990 [Natrinema saccharevitans]|uniref:Uncharacterized protein n=1 Tax=Natrinema saccharevitans TaxID=301967 RepID=A0A1S8B0K7_9EURY|nr:hypothetical protein A6E15_15990 [Natrinema saccharevitans]